MPKVITTNPANITQGHCWAPTIPKAGSNNVFIENFQAVRVGDAFLDHTLGCTPIPTTHSVIPMMGSPNVFVNNLPLVRDGDAMACGDVADHGSFTVYANGGGNDSVNNTNTIGYGILGPVIAYPSNTLIVNLLMEYLKNRPDRFIGGCPITFSPVDLYSPMVEEDTGRIYKNYPGAPFTTLAGAVLPPNAAADKKSPIPVSVTLEGRLPTGISFQNGFFLGAASVFEEQRERWEPVKVTVLNRVASSSVTINIKFQKIYGTC